MSRWWNLLSEGVETESLVSRLRRRALACLAVLAAATGLVTFRLIDVVAVVLGGLLSLASFLVLSRSVLGALERIPETPGLGHVLLLAGRLVLMALLLCGIVLIPGIRPVPVALGLSVLVLAILLEVLLQRLPGT